MKSFHVCCKNPCIECRNSITREKRLGIHNLKDERKLLIEDNNEFFYFSKTNKKIKSKK